MHFFFSSLFYLIFFFMTKLVYLMQKTISFFLSHVFGTIKSNLFLCSFFVVYITIIEYHSHLFVDFIRKPIDRHSRVIYEANLFNNDFNNFNKVLTTLMCSLDQDFEFNLTIDSCMNSNFYVVDFYSLAQFTRFNFFKALTPNSTSISISLDPILLCLFFFSMFSYLFLRNGHEIGWSTF